MVKKQTLKVDVLSGRELTNGAYYKYYDSLAKAVIKCSSEKIDVGQLVTPLMTTVQQMGDFINTQKAFVETVEVARNDLKRDRLLYYIYWSIYYANQLDPSSLLYESAHKLWVKISVYKSIAEHELMKETAEVDGIIRDLSGTEATEAVKTLGLTQALKELNNANTVVKDTINEREQERGERAADKGGITTTQLRHEMWTEWQEVAEKLSAAYIFMQDQAIGTTITAINGIVAHYRLVIANTGKTQKKDDPAPEPTDETDDGAAAS